MKCEACRFWKRDSQTKTLSGLDGSHATVTLLKKPTAGHCCVDAPKLTPAGDRWPKTEADEFCGWFEPSPMPGDDCVTK